jgi:denticleless
MILSGSSDGRLYIWDTTRAGSPILQLTCHRAEVNDVDWCKSDGLKIASGSDDGFVRLWRYVWPAVRP